MASPKTPATKKPFDSSRLFLAAAIIVALLINVVVGYFSYQYLVLDKESEQLHRLTKEHTQQQVSAVSMATRQLQTRLKKLSSQTEFQAALISPNSTLLRNLEKNNTDILSLRLFPRGTAAVDREHAYPISFAELDMLHRAEKGQDVLTEAAKVGGTWHLFNAFNIKNNSGEIAGSGLAVSSLAPLRDALSLKNSDLGFTEILQNFNPARPDILLQQGKPQGQYAVYFTNTDIPNSHWNIRFAPSALLAEKASVSPLSAILIVFISTIICVAAAFFGARFAISKKMHTQLHEHIISRATKQGREDFKRKQKLARTHNVSNDDDVLDIAVDDEDADILGLEDDTAATADTTPEPEAPTEPVADVDVPENIFRSYDIRGLAETEITLELAANIGRALGSEALDQGESSMIVARDCRNSSPELCQALVSGIIATGCDVINLGVVPSQIMYFATHHLNSTSSGVMVTASHNPAPYNGFKMIINGVTLADEAVTEVRERIIRSEYQRGHGTESEQDIMPEYIDRILADVALAGDVHVVIDAGNGATSEAAPLLFEELGCQVTQLYCEFDGNFPNHQPDPSRSSNLQDLIAKVAEVGADLGVAFDGDGDRLTVVTASGQIIWPDQLLMLFARDILVSNPGTDILFDVKSTRLLNKAISGAGGRPIMWKTGHSHMKAKMIETGALLGGEFSGHIFIKHRWYGFDDGMYACARLLEIMTLRDQSLDTMLEAFPKQVATEEILVPVDDARKFSLVDELIANGNFQKGEQTTIDGLRVDFGKGWGLVRASNTSAALTLRFEADSDATLKNLQALFKRELLKVEADLELNFG